MKLSTSGGAIVLACVMTAVTLRASDMVGVYAVVEKVLIEPSDATPQRVQIEYADSLICVIRVIRGHVLCVIRGEAVGVSGPSPKSPPRE
jgi:hypothetical protein